MRFGSFHIHKTWVDNCAFSLHNVSTAARSCSDQPHNELLIFGEPSNIAEEMTPRICTLHIADFGSMGIVSDCRFLVSLWGMTTPSRQVPQFLQGWLGRVRLQADGAPAVYCVGRGAVSSLIISCWTGKGPGAR